MSARMGLWWSMYGVGLAKDGLLTRFCLERTHEDGHSMTVSAYCLLLPGIHKS